MFDKISIDIVDLLALISGATIWECFKFFFPDLKNHFQKRQRAKMIFYESLDSVIKASDELFGKLESLAKEDFATFTNPKHSNSQEPKHNQLYVCYLICQHWATLEYIRLQSSFTSISRLKKGKELLQFIETFESRKFRLLDRSKQRIVAESMILNGTNEFRILPLFLFVDKVQHDAKFAKWVEELNQLLICSLDKKVRQRILVYGVIVREFLDHFDRKHSISRKHRIYTNKLSAASLKLIRNVLFNQYLTFLSKKVEYHIKSEPRGTV